MNTKIEREILFLRYLDALESGDVAVLAQVLSQAEQDPQLEKMLTDFHTQEDTQIMNTKKLLPAVFKGGSQEKRKRTIKRNWWQSIAAGIVLLVFGFVAGSYLTNRQTVVPPAAETLSFDESCYAQVNNPKNLVTLRQGRDMSNPTTFAVNYIFVITRPAQMYDNEFYVFYNGMTGTIRMDDVTLFGNCTDDSFPITAYPNNTETNTCQVILNDNIVFLSDVHLSESTHIYNNIQRIDDPFLVTEVEDGNLIVAMEHFTGKIGRSDYIISGDCTADSFPMTVFPPEAINESDVIFSPECTVDYEDENGMVMVFDASLVNKYRIFDVDLLSLMSTEIMDGTEFYGVYIASDMYTNYGYIEAADIEVSESCMIPMTIIPEN